MPNPSTTVYPDGYPRYVRDLRPPLSESLGQFADNEFMKIQNAFDNLAVYIRSLEDRIEALEP